MQFMIYSQDKEDGLSIRQATRDAHLAWLDAGHAVKVLVAGPWLDDDDTMRGSLLIVEADNKAAVEAWVADDPYTKAGLAKSVTIHPFKWVIGAP